MPAEFTSAEKRDEFATRLEQLWFQMLRAWDQGTDGRFYPSQEDIEDVRCAAVIVRNTALKTYGEEHELT